LSPCGCPSIRNHNRYCGIVRDGRFGAFLRKRSNLLKHNNLMLRERATRASQSMGSKRLTYLE
jgi:hypothetical protein